MSQPSPSCINIDNAPETGSAFLASALLADHQGIALARAWLKASPRMRAVIVATAEAAASPGKVIRKKRQSFRPS